MKKLLLFSVLLSFLVSPSFEHIYEESMTEMLVQCNKYQSQMFDDNRTIHQCEKENFSEDYSYVITRLETFYAKKNFWCFLFLKDDYFKLKFKLWFSHKNYLVDAYGVKFNSPAGDKFESRIMFEVTPFIVVPKKNFEPPEIFGMDLNGIDRCPLCGKRLKRFQTSSRISGGVETNAVRWPWHAVIYNVGKGSYSYKCGGTLIKSNAVVTAAHCVTEKGKKVSEYNLQVGLGETELMVDNGIRSGVFRAIIHEYFDNNTLENDIALLMLETQVKFSTEVLPICIPHQGMVLKGTGIVVGFGATEKEHGGSPVLRQVEVPIATNEDCYNFFGDILHDGNFCAGKAGVMGNVCGGDTGGGFYIKKDGLWNLKGITSNIKSGAPVLNQTCHEFSTFTDVAQYSEWIDEAINSI